MKKFLAFALTVAMLLSLAVISASAAEVYDGTSVSASLSGAGTDADPYLIANGADLAFFAANPVAGASYKLSADIVWSSYTKGGAAPTASNWTPVNFSGTFDGNGYSIAGLYVKSTGEKIGLFATVADTTVIKNLTVKDSYFEGAASVSGIVAFATPGTAAEPSYLTVENCVNYADVVITAKDGNSGGIIGNIITTSDRNTRVELTLTKCVNYGSVTSQKGNGYIGGVIGRFCGSGTISECANFGTITGTSAIVGGVLGQVSYNNADDPKYAITISDCLNMGAVNGTHVSGGIVARAYHLTTIKNCVNIGQLTITKDDTNKDRFGAIDSHEVATLENNYYLAGSAVNSTLPDTAGLGNRAGATEKSAAELPGLVSVLGDAWTLDGNGALTLAAIADAGKVETPEVPGGDETTTPGGDTTEPIPPVPTGDTAIIFAFAGVAALAAAAFVFTKKRIRE